MPTHPPPWRRLSEGPTADYRILQVREIRVEDPRDGAEHPRVVIDAPDWVNVIPVTEAGEVLLIRQFRCGVWESTLEIPGGMVDPGESPADAAARELEEETGYRPAEVLALGFCHPNPALQGNRTHSFLALGCRKVHDVLSVVEPVPRGKVPELIRRGEITHALVLAAFLLDRLREE